MNNLNSNVSIDAIERQKDELLGKKNEAHVKQVMFDEKNYLNVRLKPGETKRTLSVRLLPITPDAQTPFMVLKTHSLKVDKFISKSGYKSFICLDDPHLEVHQSEKCPLCAKAEELFAASRQETDPVLKKSLFKAACSYRAKETFVVRVIERKHEDEGVKFWRFNAHNDGTGCYDKLMTIYENRKNESLESCGEPFNVFDLINGKDFNITLTYDKSKGTTNIEIIDAGMPSPLSRDTNQALAWINDTKSWNDIYASKPFSYIQIIADGNIPVYDKINGLWVARNAQTDDSSENGSIEQIEEPNKPSQSNSFNDNDLPF